MLRENDRKAFIPFITAGDPDSDSTIKILENAENAGADIIELGFPFSDPVADGPTIQASYTRVLERRQKNEDVFAIIEHARAKTQIPIVAMISYSLVYKMGFERFIERALKAGLDGATIPDLPAEEMQNFIPLCKESNFHLISFITPGTTMERKRQLLSFAEGFIYYIAVRGITGERKSMPQDLKVKIGELKNATDLPVAVGFGISNPQQAASVAAIADGVIVGSAIVRRMHESFEKGKDAAEEALNFFGEMAGCINKKPV